MGYAHYEVYRRGERIEAGYSVDDVCNQGGCKEEIDRGLGYLCGRTPGGDEYGCGGYFCGSHLMMPLAVGDDRVQCCPKCYARWRTERLDELAEIVAKALAGVDRIKMAEPEDGKPNVLIEMADGFEAELKLG